MGKSIEAKDDPGTRWKGFGLKETVEGDRETYTGRKTEGQGRGTSKRENESCVFLGDGRCGIKGRGVTSRYV